MAVINLFNSCSLLDRNPQFKDTMVNKNKEIDAYKEDLEDVIDGLDEKLDRVLKKQEHDYLKGYSIYVKQKEKELKELINKLNEKNQNNTQKDELIHNLKQTISKLNQE